jgi:hypothetical protein
MQRFSKSWTALAILASLQAASAAVLLYWALPLFTDPPLLANGVSRKAAALERLLGSRSEPVPSLIGMADHYRWLFWRYMEGVGAGLAAGIALAGSSAVTFVVLLSQPRSPATPSDSGT